MCARQCQWHVLSHGAVISAGALVAPSRGLSELVATLNRVQDDNRFARIIGRLILRVAVVYCGLIGPAGRMRVERSGPTHGRLDFGQLLVQDSLRKIFEWQKLISIS